MSVDDGSGVVSCVQWRKTKDSSEGIYLARIGQLVSVLGQVDEFRDERQLRVTTISEFFSHRIFLQNLILCPRKSWSDGGEAVAVVVTVPEDDPNAEPCHWLEVEQAWRTVYSTAFTLPAGVTETASRKETKVCFEFIFCDLMSH